MASPSSAASARASLRLAAARLQLDSHLTSGELPDMAVSALEAGLDSPSLRLLAGQLHPTWADCGPLFHAVLKELGIDPLSRTEAGHVLLNHIAVRILGGSMTPYEGACEIADVANRFWEEELWYRLSIFIGLVCEWNDHPDHRPEFEREILDEARKLLDWMS
jgi:hypothetical protein